MLKELKKAKKHQWRLTKECSHTDVARVLCAARDVVEHTAFLSKEELERWLMDSCTDTILVSRVYAQRHGLKIDTTVRLRIGTAAGASFMTDGTVDFKLPAKTVSGKYRPIALKGHVADIGAKCLINTAALACEGYIVAQGMGPDGADGSFLMDPNGTLDDVWPMSQDDYGMPILETEGAPIRVRSKPAGLMVRIANIARKLSKGGTATNIDTSKVFRRANALTRRGHGADVDSDSEPNMPGLESSSSDVTDSSDESSMSDDECTRLNKAYNAKAKYRRTRTRKVIHTPDSWHQVLHAGKRRSEETAKGSDATFLVNGAIKQGADLTKSDLDQLEEARKSCKICKQAKMTAPEARKTTAHLGIGTASRRAI